MFNIWNNFYIIQNKSKFLCKIHIYISLKSISINYLSNKFIIDLLGIVPGLITGELFPNIYFLKILRYFHIGRFFDKIDNLLKIVAEKFQMWTKTSARTILSIVKLIIIIGLNIHIFVWIWFFIFNSSEYYHEIGSNYIKGFYFITVTFASVGYGDYLPSKNGEILYVMFIELIGLTLFAYLRGSFANISLSRSAINLINQKKHNIEEFLDIINYGRNDLVLPPEVYNKTFENLEVTYTYRVNNVFQEGEFIYDMKPKLVKGLVTNVMKNHYLNFIDFFVWEEVGFQADDRFIMKFLVAIECQIFIPGNTIISRGEMLDWIFLIEKGTVNVLNHNKGEIIAELPRYSYFGDYQVLLDCFSNVSFVAGISEKVIWYTLQKERFVELLSQFPGHMQFYTERALSTRRLYKLLIHKLHQDILQYCKDIDDIHNQSIDAMNLKELSQKKIKTINANLTKKQINKAEWYSLEKKYQIHFDSQIIKNYELEFDEDDDYVEDIDYLSENELGHKNDDTQYYYAIRKLNKTLQKFKQMNAILSNSLK